MYSELETYGEGGKAQYNYDKWYEKNEQRIKEEFEELSKEDQESYESIDDFAFYLYESETN